MIASGMMSIPSPPKKTPVQGVASRRARTTGRMSSNAPLTSKRGTNLTAVMMEMKNFKRDSGTHMSQDGRYSRRPDDSLCQGRVERDDEKSYVSRLFSIRCHYGGRRTARKTRLPWKETLWRCSQVQGQCHSYSSIGTLLNT